MVCLVTGVRGLLGRHLVAALRRTSDWDVCGVVRGEPANDTEVQCDLSDPAATARLLTATQPRRVFHLAGSFSNVWEVDLRNNVLAAGNLLGWVAEQKLDTRVVVAGSAAEYGAVAPESNPVSEEHPARPHSVYGVTKLLQTESSLFYRRRFGVDVVIARIFNLLGPGASERLFVGSVEGQIRRVLDGSLDCLTVGNLDASRDYLDPVRAADALITLMRYGGAGEVYNVGSGVPVPMRDLLRALLAESGVPTCPVREQAATAERSHDVPVIYADVQKLRRLEADGPDQVRTP